MIRFSLVIQNTKKEYLICKCPLMEQDEFSYEFLGGEIIGNTILKKVLIYQPSDSKKSFNS